VRLTLSLVLVLGGCTGHALAWNGQGHELTDSIADTLLEGTKAGVTARGILGLRLADAAKWPDSVRSVRRSGDGFVYRGSSGYSECDVFNTPAEVARMVD
jgi:hypothetical protein